MINISTFLRLKIHTYIVAIYACLFPCHGVACPSSIFTAQWFRDMGGCWAWAIFLMVQTFDCPSLDVCITRTSKITQKLQRFIDRKKAFIGMMKYTKSC